MLVKFDIYDQGALVGTTELWSESLTAGDAKQALLEEDDSWCGKLVAAGSSAGLLGVTPLDLSQSYVLQLTRRSGAVKNRAANVLQALQLFPTPEILGITWPKFTGHIRAYTPKAPPQPASLAHPVFARFLDQKTSSTAASLSAHMATSYGSPAVPNQ